MNFLAEIQWINWGQAEALKPIYYLAIILVATKSLGMLTRHFGLPQVVGMVIAGLLIGPAFFFGVGEGGFHGLVNPNEQQSAILNTFSQIGVIFILFSSGLETDVKELKKSGAVATLVALAGVIVPILFGFLGAMCFMPGGFAEAFQTRDYVLNALFVGTILAATSVGITVETLRELGHLNTKVGQTIVSAAIIDDVIGIIVLSIVTSLQGGADGNPLWVVIVKVLMFFVVMIGVGYLLRRYFFTWLVKHYPNHRRTGIYALAMCFFYAFMSEVLFDIAAITGAYMAGIMLSGLYAGKGFDETAIIDNKVIRMGYLIFSPVFFAYIGIHADFSQFQPSILLFALIFIILGVVGKIVGCGSVAKLCKYSGKDSMRIGCGMIARGEVALAVYSAGATLIARDAAGAVVGIDPIIPTICLILVSSILCPIFLKLLFRDESNGKGKKGKKVKVPVVGEEVRDEHAMETALRPEKNPSERLG